MSHCHTCRFAEWRKTPTGRNSRSKAGRCAWEKTVRVPPTYKIHGETSLYLRAHRYIWWRDNIVCPVYQKEPEA